MKYSFGLCVAVLLSLFFQHASADTITLHDSLYADSIYLNPDGAYKILAPELALGPVDDQYAHFGPLGVGPFLDLVFTSSNGVNALTIQKKATVSIWGKKDASVDTSAAQVKFIKIDQEGVILYESLPYIIGDGLNVINLPDTEYTYMEFSLTGTEFKPGSKGYLLDAVLLVQDRDSTFARVNGNARPITSRIISSYPNPFISSSQYTTVVLRLDSPGDAVLRIYDALGREVDAMSVGILEAGDHSVPFSASEPQIYFARLYVDGIPAGPAFRLVAQ